MVHRHNIPLVPGVVLSVLQHRRCQGVRVRKCSVIPAAELSAHVTAEFLLPARGTHVPHLAEERDRHHHAAFSLSSNYVAHLPACKCALRIPEVPGSPGTLAVDVDCKSVALLLLIRPAHSPCPDDTVVRILVVYYGDHPAGLVCVLNAALDVYSISTIVGHSNHLQK